VHVLAFGKVAKRDSINVKVLGRRGVGFREGEGTFLKKGSLSLPNARTKAPGNMTLPGA